MEETVKQRILAFIKAKSISQKKFEEAASLSNGYVNNLKSSPSSTILQKIFEAFPEINQAWLLTGEGSMLVTGESQPSVTESGTSQEVDRMLKVIESQQESISRLVRIIEDKHYAGKKKDAS